LWGTIELYEHELKILDTPLLQRLRQIHQTGFVFETYPSAKHTRFEHTLGVISLSSKIANSLKKRYSEIDDEFEIKVRLTALLHDIGHSAFSHTTEEIYQDCSDIKVLVSKGGEFEDKGAGEVLSYLIITSPTFIEFFSTLKNESEKLKNIEIEDFAKLIIGKSNNLNNQKYDSEIISGSFDADKLDYFPRDGRAVGIELSIDIDRLLHCIEISDYSDRKTLVVNSGGYNALQQLLFARATLFASVYHHHKVRACDCMVKSCINYFRENKIKFKRTKNFPDGFSLESAVDYLYITDFDFYAEANNYNQGTFEHEIIHDIFYRRLFKRVLVISTSTIKDFSTNKYAKAGYSAFYNLRSNRNKLNELIKDIWDNANVECSKWNVAIDIPKEPSFRKAGSALINRSKNPENPDIVSLSEVIPIEEWVKTYNQYYAQSYIFGPENIHERKELAKSAVSIFKERFGFELNEYAFPNDLN
jgi:HD superfamily phosphohydrolase